MVKNNFIDIYTNTGKESIFNVLPLNVKRDWMDDTSGGWAYNCLPLKISNQYGWVAHSPCSFTATWNGGQGIDDMMVCDLDGKDCNHVKSHFSHGIMTINTDFLIRTNPGTSLYIRGLPNYQKDGITPLDAIVETDWLPFHFPFSYRFTKPGSVTFKKGEPLFMFFPIERDYIESFNVSYKSMDENLELKEQNKRFSESRREHMEGHNSGAQKLYIKGSVVEEKASIKEHKVKLNLDKPKVN
jgi:Family of unknown function (DUF6065)